MEFEKPELLAPAGGMEAFIVAVENGADAVYLGSQAFSARGYASNFSQKELEEAIDYAHLRGVKVYITVNTLLKDREIENALKLLSCLREMGADAIIIQDLGLISLARKYLPDLPLHASTQMTLHNSEGTKFVKILGISRAVLSRELSLESIKRIKAKSEIEIETFIHGALCISYSGQCLLSSLIGGRSGNRGYCAQPCRKKYRLYCEGEKIKTSGSYLLSPKDLNTSADLGALIRAGIESFKIEGRMKRPEYVAGVVRIYRLLIDRYFQNPAKYSVSEEEHEILTQLFNRGFTEGYFFENPRGKLMSRANPHNRGIPAGIVVGYNRSLNRIRVKLYLPLRLGDGIRVENAETRPEDKGKIISSMYTERGSVFSAGKGDMVELPFDSIAQTGSTVYRTHDKKLIDSLKKERESGSLRPKIPVSINVIISSGKPIKLEIKDRDSNTVTVESEYLVEKAEKQPTLKTQIGKQISKLGNTLFEATELNVNMEGDVFVPMRQLNDIRTKAIKKLEAIRVLKWKRKPLQNLEFPRIGEKVSEKKTVEGEEKTVSEKFLIQPVLSVSIYSLEGLEAALEGGADYIYFGEGLFRTSELVEKKNSYLEDSAENFECIFKKAVLKTRAADRKIYFLTPKIVKDSEMNSVKKLFSLARKLEADGVVVSNLGVFNLAKTEKIPVIANSPLNIFNRYSLALLLEEGAQMAAISPELTFEEIKNIASYGPIECIAHGRLELMESEHCLVDGLLDKRCEFSCKKGNFALVDEKNYVFPLLMDSQCRMHLLNSRYLCTLEHIPKFLEIGVSSLRVETLGMENTDEIKRVTMAYRKAIDTYLENGKQEHEKCESFGKGFTYGHYLRGVQ
jgi:U32 family peptidase